MKYILLLLLLSNLLSAEETKNKEITFYGNISHHVANSKKYNDGKNFYIVEPVDNGKYILPKAMQLIFDPDNIAINIKENYYLKRYKLTGHIVKTDYDKNIRFYTYNAFQVDAIQDITSKIKAKSVGDITKVKFMLINRMTTPKDAKRRKEEFTYIKSIKMKAGDKVVLDMKTSYYVAENPLIKFRYDNRDANASTLELEYTDDKNIVKTNLKKIRKRKGEKRIDTPSIVSNTVSYIASKFSNRYKIKNRAMVDLLGDVTLIEDGIKFVCPKLAENGGSIPIGIVSNIDAKRVMLFSLGDSGDLELTAEFNETPHSIIDYSLRIKMHHSFDVQVVIEGKDGKFYSAKRYIDVSIGGGEA